MSTDLTPSQRDEFDARCQLMDHQHQKMCEYGNEFIENALHIRENKLFRGIYDTFDDFMAVRFGKTRQWLTQQSNRLKVVNHLPNDVEISLSAAQSLATLPDEEQADAYAEATEKAESQGKERPTTKQVKETVTARKNAKGGEYKPPETPKQTVPVGPNLKEFDRLLGAAIRHYDACATHYKWTAKAEHEDLLEAAGTVSEKYAELVEGME